MYERNLCFHMFLFIYDDSYYLHKQVSLVLEIHNITIGGQNKNNPIKNRICVIKIQKVSGVINYRWIA